MYASQDDLIQREIARVICLMEYQDWISSKRVQAIIGKRAPISAHENTKEIGFFLARALYNVYDRKLHKDHDLPEDNYLPWERRRVR